MKDKTPPANPERYARYSPGFKYCQPDVSIESFKEGVTTKGVNRLGGWGRNALHWAIANGYEDMYTFLVDQQADLNIRDEVNRLIIIYIRSKGITFNCPYL
jgi:hypothetical protein